MSRLPVHRQDPERPPQETTRRRSTAYCSHHRVKSLDYVMSPFANAEAQAFQHPSRNPKRTGGLGIAFALRVSITARPRRRAGVVTGLRVCERPGVALCTTGGAGHLQDEQSGAP